MIFGKRRAKEKESKHEMYKEMRLKVSGEVENIKGGGGGGGSSDRRDFRLPWLSLDLMKWKGGVAKRRRKGKTGVYTSEEGARAK